MAEEEEPAGLSREYVAPSRRIMSPSRSQSSSIVGSEDAAAYASLESAEKMTSESVTGRMTEIEWVGVVSLSAELG